MSPVYGTISDEQLQWQPLGVNSAAGNIADPPQDVIDLTPSHYNYDVVRVDWASVYLKFTPLDLSAVAELCFRYTVEGGLLRPFLSIGQVFSTGETGGSSDSPGQSAQLSVPFYNTGGLFIVLRGESPGPIHDSTMGGHASISGARFPWPH
jgi:hypothetical protein